MLLFIGIFLVISWFQPRFEEIYMENNLSINENEMDDSLYAMWVDTLIISWHYLSHRHNSLEYANGVVRWLMTPRMGQDPKIETNVVISQTIRSFHVELFMADKQAMPAIVPKMVRLSRSTGRCILDREDNRCAFLLPLLKSPGGSCLVIYLVSFKSGFPVRNVAVSKIRLFGAPDKGKAFFDL